MKNTQKTANKLPMPGKVRKGFRFYCVAVLSVALVLGCSVTAFAANDPIAVVNNLSDFIFGLIRAVGLIPGSAGVSCRWDFRSSPTIPASAATAFSPLRAASSSPLPKRS